MDFFQKYQKAVKEVLVKYKGEDFNFIVFEGMLIHAAKTFSRYFDNKKYGIHIKGKNDVDNVVDLQNYITIWCVENNYPLDDLLVKGLNKLKLKQKEFHNKGGYTLE